MRIALVTTFKAGRKEPLAPLLERIHAAFLASGQGEPSLRFTMADSPVPGFVSTVDRVLKRHPQLERFLTTEPAFPGAPSIRRITGDSEPFATLLAIAQGIPRSFPFHALSLQFHSAAFGEAPRENRRPGDVTPGVTVSDSWWVNGRVRDVTALTIVDGDPAGKKLPPLPEPVVAVFAACGKAKTTAQAALPGTPEVAGPDPAVARAVGDVVRDYRTRLPEVLARAALPHDLPPLIEALGSTALGEKAGPKKPVLVSAFQPLGYDCRGGTGTFALRRRTPGNLTVEINLDVGTWSNSLTASFQVHGLGFRALLPLPVSRQAMGGQYPIGDANRWRQIVDNLAALVQELDRSFVPAIEAAAGPAPEWYRPEDRG